MSLELTVGGAVVPPTGRSFRFALLGLGLVLFVAAHADADSVYEFAAPGAATVDLASSLQPGTFRYDQDGPCYYECGATTLLSWTTPDGIEALDSSDGLADESGYGAGVIVSIEGDIVDLSGERSAGVQ